MTSPALSVEVRHSVEAVGLGFHRMPELLKPVKGLA